MTEAGFEILYESGRCLVVNKPPGLLTQAPPGIDSLETRIKGFLQHRDQKPGNVYLGIIVHCALIVLNSLGILALFFTLA